LLFGFPLVGNKGGPFVATFFTAEEIDPFVAVEKFKDVVYRKRFFTLLTWKSHCVKTSTIEGVPTRR
jgi:hypothetical protein